MNSLGEDSLIQPVRNIAERILFSDSLEEKLEIYDLAPVSFNNSDSIEPLKQSVQPGRPENLRFGDVSLKRRAAPPLPATPHLVDDENRGILLHFFANHELLAAELMALALLRFPDAPTEFRKGLFQTLREEQRHTLWYIRRMKECGVSFGDYPVNGFFWDAVATMESPLDYVSRLSLTFEQANLDYACHFAEIFATAGDPKSAAIMRKIYRDEIAHVNYGLKWFREWKAQDESDWDSLKKKLIFPLSPIRAKGNKTAFNREGRLAAGLTKDYVDRLSVFERSRGRTPNVFYFNPEAEEYIAALPRAYQADKNVLSLIEDLEIIGAFLARKDDVLLMRKCPSLPHLAKLKEAGFVFPEIETLSEDGRIKKDSLLRERRIQSIRPWSKSPNLPGQFDHLLPNCSSKTTFDLWSDDYRKLFSKMEQSLFFSKWMGESATCRTSEEINIALKTLGSGGHQRAILKAPVAAAGRGLLFVSTEQPLFGGDLNAALRVIEKQGSVLIEPCHERVFDFSVQYTVTEGGHIRTMGFLRQLIDGKGRYHGTIAPLKFCQDLDPRLAQFLMNNVFPVYESDGELVGDLAAFASRAEYVGPVGVDAYIYRDNEGKLLHRPMCELNPRYTMGRLTLEIRKQIAPSRNLRFEIIRSDKPESKEHQPIVLDFKGKIESGEFVLNEILPKTRFACKISIAKNIHSFYP